jgi:tRNA nucleotidyltransferase/poly(A) polymerase
MKSLNPIAEWIMQTIENSGFQARIAGGAVRDFLSGIQPHDIDIATTALPEQIVEIFTRLDKEVIPTGLKHGTVTIVVDKIPFEVTTLRIDKETDGRHAVVEFTDDWRLDASRRDFTINAMFMDRFGEIYDYFDGKRDLKQCHLQFVGNAEDRIREDYLRILRYFRFLGKMKTIVYDQTLRDNLAIIEKLGDGLKSISGERIWAELTKILEIGNFPVIQAMSRSIGPYIDIPHSCLHYNDFRNKSYLLRLIALFNFNEDVLHVLKSRYKASSVEQDFVKQYFVLNNSRTDNYHILDYTLNNIEKRAWVQYLASVGVMRNSDAWNKFFNDYPNLDSWPVGSSLLLIQQGFEPGPELGKELKRIRTKWIDEKIKNGYA